MIERIRKITLAQAVPFLFLGFIGVLLWVITSLWVPFGYTITGHDSGLPLDASIFLKSRFYAWDDRQSFGVDNSPNFGSITLHGFDFVLSNLAGVPYAGNHVTVFFWLFLIFVSGFFFSWNLKKKLGIVFTYVFPFLITFNFFVFQSVFMLERAKYGLFAATLFYLTFILRMLNGKNSIIPVSFFGAIAFTIFNGGSWFGLPLYGSVFLIFASFLAFNFVLCIREKEFRPFFQLVGTLFFTLLLWLLLNSYAILPYLPNVFNKGYVSYLSSRVIPVGLGWVDYISQGTSFINLLRLQGVPAWYLNPIAMDPGHPYAQIYTNPVLVILSFLFPILAFGSLLIVKKKGQKRILLPFALVTLAAMFFAAGTHKPIGFLYGVIYSYLPGFAIFRTPYYKFGSAFILGISVLIAASVSILAQKEKVFDSSLVLRRIARFINPPVIIIVLGLWFGYHFVLLDQQNVFSWHKNSTTNLQVPEYVWEFKNWADSKDFSGSRILLVPPLKKEDLSDSYTWGYWSLTPIFQMLTKAPVISNELNLTNEEMDWMTTLYNSIEKGDETIFDKMTKTVGIGYIVLREDSTNKTLIEQYKKNLSSFHSVTYFRSFGQWTIYTMNTSTPLFSTTKSLVAVSAGNSYLAREFVKDQHIIFLGNELLTPENREFISQAIKVYNCDSCLIEQRESSGDLPNVQLIPSMPFYFLKELKEKTGLLSAYSPDQKIAAYLGFVLRRIAEVRLMLSLDIDNRFMIPSLDTSLRYLDNAISLMQEQNDPTSKYLRARQILDSITPMQVRLREYVGSYEFSTQSEQLRSRMHTLLWKLNQIELLNINMLGEVSDLRKKKIFYIKVNKQENTISEFYINPLSLPNDGNGAIVVPQKVLFGTQETAIRTQQTANGWIRLVDIPDTGGQLVPLTLYFDTPNLALIRETQLEQFPSGPRSCLKLKIAHFQGGKTYEVNLTTHNKTQIMRLLLRDESNPSTNNGFFRAESETRVYPIELSQPFKYFYRSSSSAKDPAFYVCTSDNDPPEIDSLAIYESFSPTVVSVSNYTQQNDSASPVLDVQEKNPAEYRIKVNNAQQPFVLDFNQGYSPYWRIYPSHSPDGSLSIKDYINIIRHWRIDERGHILVDGYANAWEINPQESSQWVVLFVPQVFFTAGLGITMTVIILLSLISGYRILHKRRNV